MERAVSILYTLVRLLVHARQTSTRPSVDLDAPSELLVLVADELDSLGVGEELLVDADRERFRVRLRVVDRHIDLEAAEGRAMEPLGELCLLAVGTAAH